MSNAIDQAEAVARNMMGADEPYRPAPWFWSDQFDAKLQIAGLGSGHDRIVVRPAGAVVRVQRVGERRHPARRSCRPTGRWPRSARS